MTTIMVVIIFFLVLWGAMIYDAKGLNIFFMKSPPQGFFSIVTVLERKDRVVDGDKPSWLAKKFGVTCMGWQAGSLKPYLFNFKRDVLAIQAGKTESTGHNDHSNGHESNGHHHHDGTGIMNISKDTQFIPKRFFVAINPRNIETHDDERSFTFAKFVFNLGFKTIEGEEIQYVSLAEGGSNPIVNAIGEVYAELKAYVQHKSLDTLLTEDTDKTTGLIGKLLEARQAIRTVAHLDFETVTLTDIGPEHNEELLKAMQAKEIALLNNEARIAESGALVAISANELAAGKNKNQIAFDLLSLLGNDNFRVHTWANGNQTVLGNSAIMAGNN